MTSRWEAAVAEAEESPGLFGFGSRVHTGVWDFGFTWAFSGVGAP